MNPIDRSENKAELTAECLERWFVRGEPCASVTEPTIGAVWLWFNGTDPVWRSEMNKWREYEGIYSPE
jgi:hypothetical protein